MIRTNGTFLADSHTHLDQYAPAEIPGIVERAREAGVGLIVSAGVTVASSEACIALAEREPLVYAGVGIHPMDLKGPVDDATYAALLRLTHHPRVLMVSEVGLDYLPTSPDRDMQHQALRRQIRLAREMGLPVVFHTRDAAAPIGAVADTLRILREERVEEVGAVMHYFQGDMATARAVLDAGYLISWAKPLLRSPELQEVARQVPLESIVFETDSYPQPFKKHRTRWTEPSHVRQVAEKVAQMKGVSVDEVVRITTANLLRLLRNRPPTFAVRGKA